MSNADTSGALGRWEELPPDPAALIESMRAFGYSLAIAVADLVDNSISARAARNDVRLHWAGTASSIAILDGRPLPAATWAAI